MIPRVLAALFLLAAFPLCAAAQPASLSGTVKDETGAVLPGVTVELRAGDHVVAAVVSASTGAYRFDGVEPGRYDLRFTLVNFAAAVHRGLEARAGAQVRVDAVMHLVLNADVTVTGKRTFGNLADVADPAQDLVGIALTASQGAITARQLDARPIMRVGEVLETVPGVIISQHSGEGKANQYYLRGFNLDHGTDFATVVAGMPVNMPTHAHGQGYSDLNFLIPELVSGVQFSKGPYFAEQGDFATAGAANINYVTTLDAPIARVDLGGEGFARGLFAVSPSVGDGHLLAALDFGHNDGPWQRPDDFRRINGLVRYSRGTAVSGLSITGMAYDARWHASDQIPERAVADGSLSRFGLIDGSDGGSSYRYSASGEWQKTSGNGVTHASGYAIGYGLDLFSNFTYYLDDPVNGDQIEQLDRRIVSGGKVTHRRLSEWAGRSVQNTFGLQLRNDAIGAVGLYHTRARVRLATESEDTVNETSGGVFAQNEIEWTPWLRTMAGMRADGYRYRVDALGPANSGIATAGIVSPKGGVTFGPWKGTEMYVDAGTGFHSNDARGTTLTRGADGQPLDRVTPLVRARGAEIGLRTVAIPHLQTTVALWTLGLDSELVFAGDAGTTDIGRPSRRSGVEWTNYFSPRPWLVFDGDVAWSRARFTDPDPAGNRIPGSVGTVVSLGATVDAWRNLFGSVRLRYFGPRPLIEDNSVQSKPTGLVNAEAGVKMSRRMRFSVQVFNLLNAVDSDIDYYYASRLPGEPAGGIDDVHFHPALPRTVRAGISVAF